MFALFLSSNSVADHTLTPTNAANNQRTNQHNKRFCAKQLTVLFAWCFVCATVNCLPADSLISAEWSDDKPYRSYAIANPSPAVAGASDSPSNALDADATGGSDALRSAADGAVPSESLVAHKRVKRLHLFRPLFVYRHQQLKKRRLLVKQLESERQRRLFEERKAYRLARLPPCPKPYYDCLW